MADVWTAILVTIDTIWFYQNKLIWEGTKIDPLKEICAITARCDIYKDTFVESLAFPNYREKQECQSLIRSRQPYDSAWINLFRLGYVIDCGSSAALALLII